jgi:hypothetical protein
LCEACQREVEQQKQRSPMRKIVKLQEEE